MDHRRCCHQDVLYVENIGFVVHTIEIKMEESRKEGPRAKAENKVISLTAIFPRLPEIFSP